MNSCTHNPYGSLSCVSDHPNGFEWCINAPAINANHTVYVESEDGNVYVIPQGHTGVFDMSSPDVSGSSCNWPSARLTRRFRSVMTAGFSNPKKGDTSFLPAAAGGA